MVSLKKAKNIGKTIENWAKQSIKNGHPLGMTSLHSPPQALPRHSPPMLYIPVEFSEDVHDPSGKVIGKQKGFIARGGTGMKHTQKRKEKVTFTECLITHEGYTRQIIEEAFANVEKRQKAQEAIKRQNDIEERARQKERNRFPNKFLRLSRYLHVRDYEKKLAEAAKTACEALTRLPLERLDLSETQKTTALSWLQIQIDKKRHA